MSILGLAALELWRQRDSTIAAASQTLTSLARSLSAQTAQSLDSVDLVLHVTADELERTGMAINPAELQKTLSERIAGLPYVRSVNVIDAAGLLVATSLTATPQPVSVADRSYFVRQRGSGAGVFISEPLRSRIDGQWIIYASLPIRPDGATFGGIVTAAISVQYFQSFYKDLLPAGGGAFAMFSTDGTLLVRYPHIEEMMGRSFAHTDMFVDRLPKADRGVFVVDSPIDGVPRLAAYSLVPRRNLLFILSLDRHVLLADWRSNSVTLSAAAGLAAVLVVALSLLIDRQTRQDQRQSAALRAQEEALRTLNQQLEMRVEERTGELRQELVTRERVEIRLREHRERIRMILDGAADGIITIDSAGTIETFNKAAQRIFGYGEDEVLGNAVSLLIPEGLDLRPNERPDERPDGGVGGREITGRRKDGTSFPLYIAISELQLPDSLLFTGIFHDLTAIKAREAELRAAKDDAEKANRAKSAFLAGMSHELRTPLNAIIGFTEAITHGIYGPVRDDCRQCLGHIKTAGDHLLALINDLLDLARIEAGRFELTEAAVDVALVSRMARRMIEPQAASDSVELITDGVEEVPALICDERCLLQILINLLSNAVKFTAAGGSVRLAAGVDEDGRMVLSVIDTGRGMASADIPRSLEPFNQLSAHVANRHVGTGLGLPLTRAMVIRHGGSLDIRSAPDEGTTVLVRFPASRVARVPALAAPAG